ncbi:MAG: hypothetical protein ED557_10580 [Balneola sp.]|nr:MAG: hypothetical protein ED557_10580 [Balneola sp.]
MNLKDELNQFKQHTHEHSLEELGNWLDQNHKTPRKMRPIYKIAASFVALMLVLVACTMPVQQEEELGYMIVGIVEAEGAEITNILSKSRTIDMNQIILNDVIYEAEDDSKEAKEKAGKSDSHKEIILVLPEADIDEATQKRNELQSMFSFESINVFSMEEEVERPLYEAALHSLNIVLDSSTPDSVIAFNIDKYLHENSSFEGSARVAYNELGKPIIEVVEVASNLDVSRLQILRDKAAKYNEQPAHLKFSILDSIVMEIREEDLPEVERIEVQKRN